MRPPLEPVYVEIIRGQRRRLSRVPEKGVFMLDGVRGIVTDVMKPDGPIGMGRQKVGMTTVWFEVSNMETTFYWGSNDPKVDYVGQGVIEKRIKLLED